MSRTDKHTSASKQKETGKKSRRRSLVLLWVLCILLGLGAAATYYVIRIVHTPEHLFDFSILQTTSPDPAVQGTTSQGGSNAENPSDSSAQQTEDNPAIVNFLLMGIDKEPGVKETYGATADCHTDALILVAVNFEENRADMISLPRDTFVNMEGVEGYYKLNGILNYGGGKTEAGFEAVCKAAEWMLGGISVDYYCAFDVDKVIEIGDLLGGVDFEMDMEYRGTSGTYYRKGMQHLDGTGIMDYMRARKNATEGEPGDKGRMTRCKKMLLALFETLKKEGDLLNIPDLLKTVQSGVYTNISLTQQLALANFALGLDTADVGMYTMTGKIHTVADWGFMFLDQENRTELVREVYGVEIEPQTHVSREYVSWLDEIGFLCVNHLRNGERLQACVQELGVDTLDEETAELYETFQKALVALQETFLEAEDTLSTKELSPLTRELEKAGKALSEKLENPPDLDWPLKVDWTTDRDVNTVFVDFR